MKEHIIINKDRTVVVPDSVRKIGIQYDHKVNTLTFDCPRYADDNQSIDLSRMAIYINFSRNDKTKGSVAATNIFVDPDDPEIMHFDFVITRSVTLVNGPIICLVCAKSTDAEGVEDNHWNSELFNKLSVGEGMEAEEELTEEEIDYITSLLQEINATHAEVADINTRVEDLEFNQEKQGVVSEVDLEAMTWTEGSYITGSGTIGSSSGYGISELVTLPKMSTLILDATGYQSDVAMIAKSDHTPLVTSVDGKTHYEYYTGEEIQVYISCKTTAAKSAKIVRNVAETLSDLERENSELKSDIESIEPTQINQNFVENILDGAVLHERSCYDTNSGADKETAVNNITSYEYSYCYEPIRVRKDSGTLLFNNLVISKVISQDIPIGMCWGKDGRFKHRLIGNNNSYSDEVFQHIGVPSGENIHLDIPEDTYYIGFIQWYQTVDNPSDFTVKQSKTELKWLDTGITKNNIVTVKTDGTGDFDSIINAVNSIKDASETNRYTVYIYQGEYDIFNELGGKAFFSTITNEKDYRECGINLKPYVSLVGIGSPILKLLPDVDSISNIAVEKTSVINCYGTNDIININIQCKNCRYGIHDESSGDSEYYYHERNIKNCKIIHYGNDYSFSFHQTNPYACGFDVGNTINIENCDFIACSWGNAVSFHDRLSNTVDTQIAIKYCNLSTLGDETLRFGSVGRDNHHKVNIVGCNLSDNIILNEETSNSGVGCSFELHGHGNNKVVHKIVSTKENDNELHYPMFSEEKSIICCRNEKIKLLKGVAYTYDRKGSAYVSEANGNVFNFIPLEDIPAYGKGLVFKCGYIKNEFLKIGKTEIGDKISFVNGIFKVGGENVIGEDDGRVDGYVLIN